MRELEPDFLSVELADVYAFEKVTEKKTRVYVGNANFVIPMNYSGVKQLVEIAKRGGSLNTSQG